MIKKFFVLICVLAHMSVHAKEPVPVNPVPALIWTNGSETGLCWNSNHGSVCSTTICLGESVCFSYSHPWVNDHNDYATNHATLYFSDGGSIVVENDSYTGPNATGCVYYTPTQTGAITTDPNTGPIAITFTINVLPATPPTLSANISPPNPVCMGTQVCIEGLTSPVINYSFTSATAAACNNTVPCPNNGTAFCFPAGNHQIQYTVNAGHSCAATAVYDINVVTAKMQLGITEPELCGGDYCFTAYTISACQMGTAVYHWAISDASGSYSYSTTTSSPTLCVNLPQGNTYSVSVFINDGPLNADATVTVPVIDPCVCFACNPVGTSGTMWSSPVFEAKYCINNNITINGNVAFKDCEVKVKPGMGITVAAGGILTLDHSRFFGEGSMWSGITILDGGRVVIVNNSLVEDAKIGVHVYKNTTTSLPQILTVENSIFNKNYMDIRIYDYVPNIAAYPFTITNSLFTCRTLASCDGFLNWPATATVKAASNPTASPLETPYINNLQYPVTTLLAPYAGRQSFYGIRAENVGYSDVTVPTYRMLVIGGNINGKDTYNLFDNHYIGVDAINSNVGVTNCIFQKGWDLLFPAAYSCGVKAISSSQLNHQLIVLSGSYTNNNKFYDVSRAVRAQDYFQVNVAFCEIGSTRVYNPAQPTQAGAYGISVQTNHYNLINASNNHIYNVDNGIDFKASVGAYAVGSETSNNGQYVGTLTFNDNTISTNVGMPNSIMHYGYKAITATGLLGGFRYTRPDATVETNNNKIKFYVNGISCSNWTNVGVSTKNNEIFVTQYASNTYQYGIEHNNNVVKPGTYFKEFGICDNMVSSLSQYNKTQQTYGIRSNQNSNQAVLCNTVTTMYHGVAFSGFHPNDAYVRFNITDQDHYGFVLENQGRIGLQGDPLATGDFLDQTWSGAYAVPDYKTAVFNSNAQFSKMNVRSGTTSDPNGSGLLSGGIPGVSEYSYAAGTVIPHTGFGNVANCMLTRPGHDQPSVRALEDLLGNIPENGAPDPRAFSVAKTQLYNYLKVMNVPAESSELLSTFYQDNVWQYREIFYNIEADMAEGNIGAAQEAVYAFTPENEIQAIHKRFFILLLKYQSQTLTGGDKEDLLSLAKGCPSLQGTVIHQARALYNLAYDEALVFEDVCDYSIPGQRSQTLPVSDRTNTAVNEAAQSDGITLYPNPSRGEVYLSISDNTVKAVEVSISSMNGVFLGKEILTATNGVAKINADLPSGVYMVTVTNTQTKQRTVKKLVVQK